MSFEFCINLEFEIFLFYLEYFICYDRALIVICMTFSGRDSRGVPNQLFSRTQAIHRRRCDRESQSTSDGQRPIEQRYFATERTGSECTDRQAQRHEFADRMQQLFEQSRSMVQGVIQRSLFAQLWIYREQKISGAHHVILTDRLHIPKNNNTCRILPLRSASSFTL